VSRDPQPLPGDACSTRTHNNSVCGSCMSGPCSPTEGCVCWAQQLLVLFPLLSEVSVVGSSRSTPLEFPYTSCSGAGTSPSSSNVYDNSYSSTSSSSRFSTTASCSSSYDVNSINNSSSSRSSDILGCATEGVAWSSAPAASSSSSSELQLRRLSLTLCHLQTTLRQLQGLTQLSVTRCNYTPAVAHHLWSSLGELPSLVHLVLEAPQQMLTAVPPHTPLFSAAPAPAAAAVGGKWQVRCGSPASLALLLEHAAAMLSLSGMDLPGPAPLLVLHLLHPHLLSLCWDGLAEKGCQLSLPFWVAAVCTH
jgi:hypothetical protein